MAYGTGGVSATDATAYARRKVAAKPKRKPKRRVKKCPHGVGPNGKCLPLMGVDA